MGIFRLFHVGRGMNVNLIFILCCLGNSLDMAHLHNSYTPKRSDRLGNCHMRNPDRRSQPFPNNNHNSHPHQNSHNTNLNLHSSNIQNNSDRKRFRSIDEVQASVKQNENQDYEDDLAGVTNVRETILGELIRRYSFRNVYQCHGENIKFKLSFHSSPFIFAEEEILENVKKCFQFATLSIQVKQYECTLLEPLYKIGTPKSSDDIENLKFEITNYHSGILSGRFVGIIKKLNLDYHRKEVHLPFNIHWHCRVPDREEEIETDATRNGKVVE